MTRVRSKPVAPPATRAPKQSKKPAGTGSAKAAPLKKWAAPLAPAPVAPAPAAPSRAAVSVAAQLHQAMHSGLTGLGVAEAKLFTIPYKYSKDELAEIRRAYALGFKGKNGKPADLLAEIKHELSKTEFAAVEQLFEGHPTRAAALALKKLSELSLDPTDSWPEALEILRPLAEKPELLLETAREYLNLVGTAGEQKQLDPGPAFLTRLGSALGRAEFSLASDWLVKAAANGGVHIGPLNQRQQVEASEASAAKKELGAVLRGGSEKAILESLGQLKPTLRPWISGDAGLMGSIATQLRGLKLEQARALLGNDDLGAKAIEIRRTLLDTIAAPALGVFASVVGKDGNANALSQTFQAQTGASLATQNMSVEDKALFKKLVLGQTISADEALRLDGLKLLAAIATKDFEEAKRTLEGKTKGELDTLTRLIEPALRAYERRAAHSPGRLQDHLERTFGGREKFELLQMLGKGKPQSQAEELEQQADLAQFERSPVLDAVEYGLKHPRLLAAAVAVPLATPLLFRNGAQANFRTPDTEGGRLDQRLALAKASGGGEDGALLLSQAVGDNQSYQANKDDTAHQAKQVLKAVAIAAAPLTGGASLALLAAMPAEANKPR
jgi:hypothetical protein